VVRGTGRSARSRWIEALEEGVTAGNKLRDQQVLAVNSYVTLGSSVMASIQAKSTKSRCWLL